MAAPPRYSLLAIDLDGTLLCPRGKVSETNRDAVARAKASGIRVTVCTGRGYNECKHITAQINQTDPVVVAGGSIVAHAHTGRTLRRFNMHPPLVRRLVDTLVAHDHAALVLKDAAPADTSTPHPAHDYLIVSPRGESAIDPVTRWWFDDHKIRFHVVDSLDHDQHPDHTVRVGVCGTRRATTAAAGALRTRFADDVVFNHFNAVVPLAHGADPEDNIVILEAFDRSVSKWNAIEHLAAQEGIHPARIAAIGNDINDIAMLQGASLAIAMGNAIPEAKAVAHRHTLDNDADGVAHAIDRILAGEW